MHRSRTHRSRLLVAAWLLLVVPTSLLRGEELAPPDALDGPPFVVAKCWAIADGETGELLWYEGPDTVRQIASTTKIMTAHLVLELAREEPGVLDEVVTFSERADETRGSTAGVKAGERLTVRELLYGLLLPSGNDAAVALAEHFGDRFDPPAADDESKEKADPDDPLVRFTAEMNRRAKSLGMQHTTYLDPHGNSRNTSTPRDLLKLARAAWKNDRFREYVGTRAHGTDLQGPDGTRNVTWRNTNQLLGITGFDGVKTGTTGGAGACLVSTGTRDGERLFLVILGSVRDARYVDSRNLYRWAWRQRLASGD